MDRVELTALTLLTAIEKEAEDREHYYREIADLRAALTERGKRPSGDPLRFALESGFMRHEGHKHLSCSPQEIERFDRLVRADERDAVIKLVHESGSKSASWLVDFIRARRG